MTDKLKTKEKISKEYHKHKEENMYKSVMDVIVKANRELFEKEEGAMCQALFDIYKDSLMKMAEDEVKERVSREVTERVSREVTERVSREVREEVTREVREEAREKRKQDIINLMRNAKFTLEQAFDVLMVPEEERQLYHLG